ncbi:MAG: type II toxin-antitoxin system RelB/DinJ family antitoxin [Sphingomonadales bacterium]|nr:type II toxin-antitoxin system RelB/DinJ family antitoxin [Sphingomonadales bacterium]
MAATENVRARIGMMLRRVAEEKRLPFDVKVPNAESREAMRQLDAGDGRGFDSADELFDDLGI